MVVPLAPERYKVQFTVTRETYDGRERLEALLAEFDREAADGPSSVTVHLAAIRDVLALTKPPVSGQKTR